MDSANARQRVEGRRRWSAGLVAVVLVLLWSPAAFCQRGAGENAGVGQMAVKPGIVRISGALKAVHTHPCEQTTGKADVGTHLIVKAKDGRELNIHLGPAAAVGGIVRRLEVGRKLELSGFHTEKMSENHYAATSIVLDGKRIRLRDAALRPYWASSYSLRRGRQGYGFGYGRGIAGCRALSGIGPCGCGWMRGRRGCRGGFAGPMRCRGRCFGRGRR